MNTLVSQKARNNEQKIDEGLEEIQDPPQRVPCSNLDEEWASHKPTTSPKRKHHHPHDHKHGSHPDEEAVAMEEGVPFKEKEKITGTHPKNLVTQEGIDVELPDTTGGQRVVSPSRRPDVSPGAEAPGTEVHPPTEQGRHTRIPERIIPGAFREGGLNNEEGYEEEEVTIQSATEPPPIPPTLSAELVDAEEEERRRQYDIKKAKEEALEDVRKKAVVAEVVPEVVPEVISQRGRRWKFAGAFLLLVLIVVGVVLGTQDKDQETYIPPDLIALLSNSSSDGGEALKNPSTPQREALKWLAEDANLTHYTDQEKIQRYALATLYYSTNGSSWTHDDFWLSNADVCEKWYQSDNGTICNSSREVFRLDLEGNNLIGTIPPEIGMLSDSLEELTLNANALSGTIPTEIVSLTKLTCLDLDENALKGTIPTELGLLSNLDYLAMDSSQLTGTFPTNLGSLSLLKELTLRGNHLNGTIPTEVGLLRNMEYLYLYSNGFTGTIPPSLASLSLLKTLDFYENALNGTIPTELGLLSSLTHLHLFSNQVTGTIPTELGLLSKLDYLSLKSNHLTGTVPTILANLTLLQNLYLDDNDLTGSLDAFCVHDFDQFSSFICGQKDKMNCSCCNVCCIPQNGDCCKLPFSGICVEP